MAVTDTPGESGAALRRRTTRWTFTKRTSTGEPADSDRPPEARTPHRLPARVPQTVPRAEPQPERRPYARRPAKRRITTGEPAAIVRSAPTGRRVPGRPADAPVLPPPEGRHIALWTGRPGDPHGNRPDPGLLEIGTETVLDAALCLLEAGVAR
ncbi:hypothetical protein AB0M95_23565 [Sphaerisporangium sp. NPDC051017]|uniref:hypothetical protein n=1 Tax=Sphaerisporangium sp. NPDC051017 TaxID=3154636 RepID=UPI0034307683